ncbi:histone family protein DNA-binding protein [Kribbella flavida DSM 17836]|uniref:Histone family protein DNA-binding protein n=1 Tax=Kribbella flavida (strain DSM 17836 / JCM 10339 / NBRC 14399) TaxID=479435 RepID=D2Q0S1_KRIFD|nr:HU family DNA-binding protein [Kribbella flavida]ADB33871.1 histone family protein DNA-binding protein [Kribbella flavida DSM 17836]
MNKSQLVEALAVHFDGNRRSAQHALESVIDTVQRELTKKGGKVAITGFGAFEAIERGARMVRNPRTGETKRAKKTVVPKFRAGAELKAVVSGAKKLPKLTTPKPGATATKAAAPAKKAPAKTVATKTAAKKAPAKAAATKTVAKKAPAKKAPAKAAATKTVAKKAPAKKAPAKTVAKKAPAKKAPAKKAPAKKATSR